MDIILIIQLIISIMLITAILLQSQGGGLGATFGGSTSYHTKRGMERGLFIATIVLAVLFTLVSVIALM